MTLKATSVAAFALMVAGIAWLAMHGQLVARHVWSAAIQLGAIGLMVWARLTFGKRSFHASANPTAGGLVTSGPLCVPAAPDLRGSDLLHVGSGARLPNGSGRPGRSARDDGRGPSNVRGRVAARADVPDYQAYKTRTARVMPYLL